MRVYIRILFITSTVQLIGFVLTYLVDSVVEVANQSTVTPIWIGLASVLVSMLLAFVLVKKWCTTRKTAAITFLLLPTNYTWLILLYFVIRFVGTFIDILDSITSNFG